MMLKPKWYDYATFDDDGYINGIRDDAPKAEKEDYEKYVKEEGKAKQENLKI